METALREIGAPYSVITEDSDLSSSEPREYTACRIYKIQGDFRRLNIRNTAEEVNHLPAGRATEVREIFSRYELITVGYSGGDLGVMRLLDETTTVYNRYWIMRGALIDNDILVRLLPNERHQAIACTSSDEFMVDLQNRIRVFTSNNSDEDSPRMLYDLGVKLLESGSTIALVRKYRQYRARFIRDWPSFLQILQDKPIQDVLHDCKEALSPSISLGWAFC